MKKQLRSKLSLDRETFRVLAQNGLDKIAGGRIDLSAKLACQSSGCPDTIPITDACATITCANC